MKLLGFVVLVALVFVASAQYVSLDTSTATYDLTCKTSADCTSVTTCNSCACPVAAAVTAAKATQTAAVMCPMIACAYDVLCDATVPACKDSKCVLVPNQVVIPTTVQSCSADTDCRVFQPSCNANSCCSTAADSVAVNAANFATLSKDKAALCPAGPVYDCAVVRCAASAIPKCVNKVCTFEGTVAPVPPPLPVCKDAQPNSLCTCGAVSYSSTGVATNGWICPVTCAGTPPSPKCYCGSQNSGATLDRLSTMQWICPKEICPADATKTNCFCGTASIKIGDISVASTAAVEASASVSNSLTAQWICPVKPTCTGTPSAPKTLACNSVDAVVECVNGVWTYTCPVVNPCSCNNMPLPTLDATVQGCTTVKADWFCSSSIGVSGTGIVPLAGAAAPEISTVAVANAAKRQTVDASVPVVADPLPPISDCAKWVPVCPSVNVTKITCQADYSCGGGCYDASLPIPQVACRMIYDPVAVCQQQCRANFGKCAPLLLGTLNTCGWAKSVDYDICVSKCSSVVPVEDKCTYLNDKCLCESNGCGWCETSLVLDTPVASDVKSSSTTTTIKKGVCSSVSSQSQCIFNAGVFTADAAATSTTSSGATTMVAQKPVCAIPLPVDPIVLPVQPPVDVIDKCLVDSRCVAPVDINKEIQTISAAAAESSVAKTFIILVTATIKSEGGLVNLAVDVNGDREPTAAESKEVCMIVAKSVSQRLNFSIDRVKECVLAKVTNTAVKRAVSGVSNSYVANIQVAGDSSSNGAAAAVLPVVAMVAAAVALI